MLRGSLKNNTHALKKDSCMSCKMSAHRRVVEVDRVRQWQLQGSTTAVACVNGERWSHVSQYLDWVERELS